MWVIGANFTQPRTWEKLIRVEWEKKKKKNQFRKQYNRTDELICFSSFSASPSSFELMKMYIQKVDRMPGRKKDRKREVKGKKNLKQRNWNGVRDLLYMTGTGIVTVKGFITRSISSVMCICKLVVMV